MAESEKYKLEALGSGFRIAINDLIVIVPGEAIAHSQTQHSDGSKGSAFLSIAANPRAALAILANAIAEGRGERAGPAVQVDTGFPIGHDALILGGATPGSFLMKEDSGHGVLTPATEAEPPLTRLISAIVLPTSDPALVPPDMASDPAVAQALADGKLRTMVTYFPGRSVLPGMGAVPRAAGFAAADLSLACAPETIDRQGVRFPDIGSARSPEGSRAIAEALNEEMRLAGSTLTQAEVAERVASLAVLPSAPSGPEGLLDKLAATRAERAGAGEPPARPPSP